MTGLCAAGIAFNVRFLVALRREPKAPSRTFAVGSSGQNKPFVFSKAVAKVCTTF